jgi:hypothetical protein
VPTGKATRCGGRRRTLRIVANDRISHRRRQRAIARPTRRRRTPARNRSNGDRHGESWIPQAGEVDSPSARQTAEGRGRAQAHTDSARHAILIMTLPKARVYTAGNRIGRLDTLMAVRTELGRLYRACWAKKIDTTEAGKLAYLLSEVRRTLVAASEQALFEREVAAKERLAERMAEIARNPALLHSRPAFNVSFVTVDNGAVPQVQVIDGEVSEVGELPAPKKDTLQ